MSSQNIIVPPGYVVQVTLETTCVNINRSTNATVTDVILGLQIGTLTDGQVIELKEGEYLIEWRGCTGCSVEVLEKHISLDSTQGENSCSINKVNIVHTQFAQEPVDYDVIVDFVNGTYNLSIVDHETRTRSIIDGSVIDIGTPTPPSTNVSTAYDAVWFSPTEGCYYTYRYRTEYTATAPFPVNFTKREIYKYDPNDGSFELSEEKTDLLFSQFNIDYLNGGGATLSPNTIPPQPAVITEIEGVLYVFEGTGGEIYSVDQAGTFTTVQQYSNIVDTNGIDLDITSIIGTYWLGEQLVVSYTNSANEEYLGIVQDVPTFSIIQPTGFIGGVLQYTGGSGNVTNNSIAAPFSDTEIYLYRGNTLPSGEQGPFIYDITTGELTPVEGQTFGATDGTDRLGFTYTCESFYQHYCNGLVTYYDPNWNVVELNQQQLDTLKIGDCDKCCTDTSGGTDPVVTPNEIIDRTYTLNNIGDVATPFPLSGVNEIKLFSYSVDSGSIEVSYDGGVTYNNVLTPSSGAKEFGSSDASLNINPPMVIIRALEPNTIVQVVAEYV